MSRDIKFRVWVESFLDEETGMYIPDYISSWQNGTNWDIDKVYTRMSEPEGYKFKEDTCKFTLMQYTGLKDKNGKEIYEGDIVVVDSKRCQIVWVEDEACWRAKPEFTKNSYYVMSYNGKGSEEVIGNIYENPELLNDNT